MACDCLETSKGKILAKLAENHPTYKISDGDFANRIYCFDEDMPGIILTHKFEYEYTFTKVNGTESYPKKTSFNINPSYCGFCGKKFSEEETK